MDDPFNADGSISETARIVWETDAYIAASAQTPEEIFMDIIIQNSNVDKLIDETKAKCSTYFDINILPQDTASTALFFANVAYYISGIPPYDNEKKYENLTEEKKLKMLKEINSIFEKYLADKENFSEMMNYVTAFYVSLADNEQAVFLKITNKTIKKNIERLDN